MPQPVIVLPIVLNGCLHDPRHLCLEMQGNRLLGALDNPLQDVAAGLLIEIIRIVLDIAVADDLGIEGNDDQSPPDPVVIGADLGKMVRVEDQRVRRCKGKGSLVFLFREDLIRRADLLDHRGIEPHALLHLGGNDKTLSLQLCHLRLHISLAVHGQRLCGQLPAVGSKHPGDRVPEGRLAVGTTAIGDDQMLLIDLANRSHADY